MWHWIPVLPWVLQIIAVAQIQLCAGGCWMTVDKNNDFFQREQGLIKFFKKYTSVHQVGNNSYSLQRSMCHIFKKMPYPYPYSFLYDFIRLSHWCRRILTHSSTQYCFCSLRFLDICLCTALSKYFFNIKIGLRSGLFSFSHSDVDLLLFFGFLSCCMTQFWPRFNCDPLF